MSEHGARWAEEEAFRQGLIRKAMLLGFTATEYKSYHLQSNSYRTYWQFTHNGELCTQYGSLYSAAYEFMRLNGYTQFIGGLYRGNNKDI